MTWAVGKAADALAIDKFWIMARLKENAERALQAIAVTDAKGNKTGEYRYEGNVANRALKLLGKQLGMFVERSQINLNRTTSGLSDSELEAIALGTAGKPERIH